MKGNMYLVHFYDFYSALSSSVALLLAIIPEFIRTNEEMHSGGSVIQVFLV